MQVYHRGHQRALIALPVKVVSKQQLVERGAFGTVRTAARGSNQPGVALVKRRILSNNRTLASIHNYRLRTGNRTRQASSSVEVYISLKQEVRANGLSAAFELAQSHSYLPKVHKDFTVEPISVRFGKWKLLWWTLVPVGLPQDDEAQPVLDYYRDSAEFLRQVTERRHSERLRDGTHEPKNIGHHK